MGFLAKQALTGAANKGLLNPDQLHRAQGMGLIGDSGMDGGASASQGPLTGIIGTRPPGGIWGTVAQGVMTAAQQLGAPHHGFWGNLASTLPGMIQRYREQMGQPMSMTGQGPFGGIGGYGTPGNPNQDILMHSLGIDDPAKLEKVKEAVGMLHGLFQ